MEEPRASLRVSSSLNHRDLPLVDELVLIAIRKSISERLVAPGVIHFPLVWPAHWWPAEIRPNVAMPQSNPPRPPGSTFIPSAAERVTGVLRRLKGRSPIPSTVSDLGLSAWRTVSTATVEVDLWQQLRPRSFSIGDLRGCADECRRSHPAVRKRSLSLHDDELGESPASSAKQKRGLLSKFCKIGKLIKKTILSTKNIAGEGISRENSSNSHSNDCSMMSRLSFRANETSLRANNTHSPQDLLHKAKSVESISVLTQGKGKHMISEVLKIGKKLTTVLHDSHRHVSPLGTLSTAADSRLSPLKVNQSLSASSLESLVATQQRYGYLRLESVRKESESTFTLELRDPKGKLAGHADVIVHVLNWSHDGASNKRLNLCISKLVARGLKNVDICGANEPYLELAFGSLWSMRTSVKNDGDCDAEWLFSSDNLKTRFSATPEDLRGNELKVAARAHNKFMAHVLIGAGTVNLGRMETLIPSKSSGNDAAALVFVVLKFHQIYLYGRKSEAREELAPLLAVDLSGAFLRYSPIRPVFEINYTQLKGRRSSLTLWAHHQSETMEWVRSLTNRAETR